MRKSFKLIKKSKKLALSIALAIGCGFCSMGYAATYDMNSDAYKNGIILTEGNSSKDQFIYKWNATTKTVEGGKVVMSSQVEECETVYCNLVVDKNDFESLGTKDFEDAITQLLAKCENNLPLRNWGETMITIQDNTGKIYRQYEMTYVYDTVNQKDRFELKKAEMSSAITNIDGTSTDIYFGDNNQYLTYASTINVTPDFSQATADHTYKGIYSSGRDLTITNYRDSDKTYYSNIFRLNVNASNDAQSKAYAIYNDKNSDINVVSNEYNFTVVGNEATGIYAGNEGTEQSNVMVRSTDARSIEFNVTGTESVTGIEAGKNGVITLDGTKYNSTTTKAKVSLNLTGDGYAVYAHDGGIINFVNTKTNSIDYDGVATIRAEKGGQISIDGGFTNTNGILYTTDANSFIIADVGGTFNGATDGNITLKFANTSIWNIIGDAEKANVVKNMRASDSTIKRTYVNMDERALEVENYSGNTSFVYQHDAEDPTKILGADVTIKHAEPLKMISAGVEGLESDVFYTDSTVLVATSNTGIDINNKEQVTKVLDELAKKIYYTAYVDGERNLTGTVEIQQGLTSAAVGKSISGMTFDEATGQGKREGDITSPYSDVITGNVKGDKAYDDVFDKTNMVYSFDKDVDLYYKFIKPTSTTAVYTAAINNLGDKPNSTATTAAKGPSYTIDLNGHDLNILTVSNPTASGSGFPMLTTSGIHAMREGTITIDNPGKISMELSANYYYGNGIAASTAKDTTNGAHVVINNDNTKEHAVVIRGGIPTKGFEMNYHGMFVQSTDRDTVGNSIDVKGLVDIETDGAVGMWVRGGPSRIDVGGGIINAKNYDAIWTVGKDANINVNVVRDEEGNITGAGTNDVQITGNVKSVTQFYGGDGIINLAMTTKDSFLKGFTYGIGQQNLWLTNGATWYNQANQFNDWTGAVSTTDVASRVNNFVGGNTAAEAGIIFQNSREDINVANYSGNTTIMYSRDTEDINNVLGGNFVVASAAEGSQVNLITDYADGLDVDKTLDNLAGKLYYTGYIANDDGVREENLSATATIAEGLTTASATKAFGELAYNEETGQGIIDWKTNFKQTEDEVNAAILGTAEKDIAYVKAGILNTNTNIYNFTEESTTINVTNNPVVGGMYVGTVGSAISGAQNDVTIDLHNNALVVNAENKSHSTGITATKMKKTDAGKVEINNAGAMNVYAKGTGQTAALFANTGGEIIIHNGGEGQENKVLTVRADASNKVNGAVIKTMNGLNGAESKIIIDGLVDVVADGDMTDGYGSNEAISAVASTIEIGGGKIAAINDAWAAIRAYGEFVSQNIGTVNVNVVKDADGNVIGGGDNKVTIDGDFITNGGMGSKGRISVGLNGADSYWVGNYSDNVGYGVTPGQLGSVNVFAKNGATWKGFNTGSMNAQFEGKDSAWTGFSTSDKMYLSLKDGATWHNAITPDQLDKNGNVVDAQVGYLDAKAGVIDMTGANVFVGKGSSLNGTTVAGGKNSEIIESKDGITGNVVIGNYSGDSTVIYRHEKTNDGIAILGGNFTINNAAEGSKITLSTDNSGINMDNPDEVLGTLESLANKLYYAEIVAEEEQDAAPIALFAADDAQKEVVKDAKLTGKVQIAEGLTSASAALKVGDMAFNAANGQGTLVNGTVVTPEAKQDSEVIYGSAETAMMRGAKSAMASSAMMWRSELNDMKQRLGDITLNGEKDGIWAKYYGGKYNMNAQNTGFNTSYKAYQVGYDKKVTNDVIVGLALSHNKGNSTYTGGKGEQKMTSLSVYGTMVKEDGQHADVVVKAGKLDNEYHITNDMGRKLDGDYDANAFSVSAEYGKKINGANGFYFDPSVQFSIGRIGSSNYDASSDYLDAYGRSKALHVQQDSFTSAIGRIGIGIGQKTEKSDLYAKVALAHEFSGDYSTTFKADGEPQGKTNIDFGDTWYELRFGGSVMLNANSMLYASYGRNFGGDVNEKWRLDAGLRFNF